MAIEVEMKFESSTNHVFQIMENNALCDHRKSEIVDIYLNNTGKDLNASDEAFRLRQIRYFIDETSFTDFTDQLITYKGPKKDKVTKSREEIEIKMDVENIEEVCQMFCRVGFYENGRVTKMRHEYTVDHEGDVMHLAFDTVVGLGDFIEIEFLCADDDQFNNARNRLLSFADKLGLSNPIHKGYVQLLKEKQNG